MAAQRRNKKFSDCCDVAPCLTHPLNCSECLQRTQTNIANAIGMWVIFYAINYEKFADSGIRPFFSKSSARNIKRILFSFNLLRFNIYHGYTRWGKAEGEEEKIKLHIPQKFENFGDFEDWFLRFLFPLSWLCWRSVQVCRRLGTLSRAPAAKLRAWLSPLALSLAGCSIL